MNSPDFPAWSCPDHDEPLAGEARSGRLSCPHGHSYPVRAGIPRFVEGGTYADLFGAQWKRYRLTQLDSYTGTTISCDRARRAIGDRLWKALDAKQVLECGCGAGRFTEVLLAQGAHVTSIDLSDAVEANQENFPQNPTHRVAQADIERLPFEPYQYDLVFCLGVVQHTKSPELTVARLYEQVKPGGTLVVDHYCYEIRRLTQIAPSCRQILRRMPPDKTIPLTERLVALLLPLHKRAGRFAPLVSRLSPVASYYRTYPMLPDAIQREWAMLDTHDSLTDWYKRLRTRHQVERMIQRLNAEIELCARQGNGIEARCRRPL